MAKRNKPSGLTINPAYADMVFIGQFDDLAQRTTKCRQSKDGENYEILQIARLLRGLVVDAPLFNLVNRERRVELQVPQWVMPNWPGINPEKNIARHYEKYCPPDAHIFWVGGRWYPYSIQEYLNRLQPGFVVGEQSATPGEAIGLYANALGGVHLDGSIKEKDLKAVAIDQSLRVGSRSAIAHLLVDRVAGDILRALSPLYETIVGESDRPS